jgi:hypothetical protein
MTRVFFITVSLVVSDPNQSQNCLPNEEAPLSGTEDSTAGKGDDPSPITATGPIGLIEVAPLTAPREPAIMSAARAANISFLAFFTGQPPYQSRFSKWPGQGAGTRFAHLSNSVHKLES